MCVRWVRLEWGGASRDGSGGAAAEFEIWVRGNYEGAPAVGLCGFTGVASRAGFLGRALMGRSFNPSTNSSPMRCGLGPEACNCPLFFVMAS